MIIAGILSALVVGFLAGLFSFKVKSRWCRECGSALNCPVCMGAGAHRLPASGR